MDLKCSEVRLAALKHESGAAMLRFFVFTGFMSCCVKGCVAGIRHTVFNKVLLVLSLSKALLSKIMFISTIRMRVCCVGACVGCHAAMF